MNIQILESVWRRIRRPSKSTMEQIRKLEIAPVPRRCFWQPPHRLCVPETETLSYGSSEASDIAGPTRFNRYGASRAYMHMIIEQHYMALLNWIKNG
jgi:hypothetical protein